MASPKIETIMADFAAAVAGISVANGYTRDLELVERYRLTGMDQHPNTIAEIAQGGDFQRGDGLNLEGHSLTVQAVLKVRHDPTSDGLSTDTVMNEHVADIYKAVMADRTRGGAAQDTRWVSTESIDADEDGNRAQVEVSFVIDYRHLVGDMTSG